jgi:hypothetical protein
VKTVDAHYYADEGHNFEKRENQIDSIRHTVAWFEKRATDLHGSGDDCHYCKNGSEKA